MDASLSAAVHHAKPEAHHEFRPHPVSELRNGLPGILEEKYDVSIGAGARVLLPAVRAASKDTPIIADGFSRHSQISNTTDRRALHLAQIVQMALRGAGPLGDYPEAVSPEAEPLRPGSRRAALLGAGAALTGAALA